MRVALIGALALLCGCARWVVARGPAPRAAETVTETLAWRVRLERMDGGVVTLTRPRVEGDSLVGSSHKRRLAVPFADIRTIERQQPHTYLTLGVIAVAVSGAFLFTVLTFFPPGL